jgi:hypothetical protein
MFLAVLDKLECKFAYFLYLANLPCSKARWFSQYPLMYRLGHQLYETLDRTKFGNEAVILFKSLDVLAVGASLR